MAESPKPQDAPRRLSKEYEDPHFHDEDEVTPPPIDEEVRPRTVVPVQPNRRKLPPPPRRFHED